MEFHTRGDATFAHSTPFTHSLHISFRHLAPHRNQVHALGDDATFGDEKLRQSAIDGDDNDGQSSGAS